MDISTPLIFVALFLLAFCSLFFVYKYSIKEKSYEEALAEQRQTTNALLGVKPKPKDKKNKKAAKKLKEKQNPPGNESDESENIDNANLDSALTNKPHVEFKEEPEEVPAKEVVQTKRDDIFKQETIKEKDKGIKEKKQSLDASPSFKNKRSVKSSVTNNSNVNDVSPATVEKEPEEKILETVAVIPQTNGIVGNLGKEKKKKKSEINTKQQLSAERDGLIKLVRKAEFSKSEVQLLIDLLLNKQLEAPEVLADWTEGKSDPVQKLKKQLAEKEKALIEEQEALQGVQAKLKEVRTEQQTERTQFLQKIRGLEEVIQNKQIEHQATNNRLQVNTQKLQQLQADLSAEILKTHNLMEENAALQMQAQQFEVRISQIQETDSIITKLRNDIEELSNRNQHLTLDLQQSMAEKDHQQQQFIIQMNNLEQGLKQQIQQHEESHQDLENNLKMALRQENDWKIEISNLNTALQQQFEEKRRLEHIVDQLKEELQILNNEKAENSKAIAQLRTELQQLTEQASQVNGSSEDSKEREIQILNLTNELSSARDELSSIKNKLQQTEAKYKIELESSNKKYSTFQTELEEQKKRNNELRTKNWKLMEALNVAENRNKASITNKPMDLDKIKNDILEKERNSQKDFIQRLFPEIEDLHSINSDDWQTEFGRLIRNYVSDLKEQQVSPESSEDVDKLQAQLQHYKNIIDDTAGMLNKLETHIEKEEINWRCQLQSKNSEIENLKANCVSPLKTKISNLEKQLSEEIKTREQLYQECNLLKNRQPQKTDATATIEKLSEEVNRLREQLRIEQTKNGDVNGCLKAQNNRNSNSTNGPALIEVPSIRNANICSNMGCQFLYCDGSNCHGN